MEWREFLEKDSLDGKGANNKIKPAKWIKSDQSHTITDTGGNKKELKVSPKKFLDSVMGGESGKTTNLIDSHSNDDIPNTFGDNRHKIGHNPIMGKKEDKRTLEEKRTDEIEDKEITRGDELGSVEEKKRKLRRGESMPKPHLSMGKVGEITNHDGRHTARAAMEEGHEAIPIDVKTRNNQSYSRDNIDNLTPEKTYNIDTDQGEYLTPSNEKDTRHPIFGRKKAWEDWLEKDSLDGKQGHNPKKDPDDDFEGDMMRQDHQGQSSLQRYRGLTDKELNNNISDTAAKLHDIKGKDFWINGKKKAWEAWLKKETQPTGLTGKKLALWKKIQEDNKEDSDNQYYTKAWEEWLKKGKMDKFKKGLKNLVTAPDIYPSQIKHVKVDDEEKKKSWELFLEKNNAIETDHKEGEKKHEWDGKFSSSTIRDDAKDEKAMDEESDEIMEDAGLEEIEKLKSWESWLEIKKRKNQGAPVVPVTNDKDGNPVKPFPKKEVFTDVNNQNAHQNPAPVINSKTQNTMVRRMIDGEMQKVPFGGEGVKGSGNKKTSTKDDKMMSKELNNKTPTQIKESFDYVTNSPKYQESINRDTELTDEQLEERDAENWRNSPAGQAYHKKQEGKKKRGFKTASWEVWLEKDALDGKQGIDKLPKADITPIQEDAKEVIERDIRGKKNEMYKSWLEKMQGAGDARFGNQHLTGLDQKPVNNEEDEANILPEKDEKHDEKEEKQEKTNNKPYKVLGDER
jgi:hypothetical protein